MLGQWATELNHVAGLVWWIQFTANIPSQEGGAVYDYYKERQAAAVRFLTEDAFATQAGRYDRRCLVVSAIRRKCSGGFVLLSSLTSFSVLLSSWGASCEWFAGRRKRCYARYDAFGYVEAATPANYRKRLRIYSVTEKRDNGERSSCG